MTTVSARGLVKRYGRGDAAVTAVAGVDLDLRPGELVAVMGASGSGKSTLLHLLAGIARPDAGTVRVGGTDIERMGDAALTALRRRHVGIVFQAYNLMPTLTAQQNVALPLLMNGSARSEAADRAEAALARVGLRDRGGHLPAQLSGGEQQRVAIARALVVEPVVVLADEPTGNLDRRAAQRVCTLLEELARGAERSALVVTHEPTVAAHADRVVVLSDGRVVDQFARGDVAGVEGLSRRYLDHTAEPE